MIRRFAKTTVLDYREKDRQLVNFIAVAAPDYLRSHGRPVMPQDLNSNHCIRIRTGRGQIYKWEFERGDDRREIDV
ncbi:hypothetical protein AB9E26_36520, partial [Rhizobium leguminosarum]